MRTALFLPVTPSMLSGGGGVCSRGWLLWGTGVSVQGGVYPGGGGVCPDTTPVDRILDTHF